MGDALTSHLALRRAGPEDAALLLAWRNDPEVRRQSFSSDPIEAPEHAAWLERKLADESCRLFVLESDAGPVGQARIDTLRPRSGEISVSVAPERRGGGHGRTLIRLACEQAAADLGLVEVVARVKRGNDASLRAFAAAGFRERSDDDGVVTLAWTPVHSPA